MSVRDGGASAIDFGDDKPTQYEKSEPWKKETPASSIPSKPSSDAPFYHDHAVLSQASYDPKKYRQKTEALGYKIDSQLSTRSRTVYYNKKSGKAVLAYKGTTPSNWRDLAADAGILAGLPTHLIGRFRGAEQAYRNTRSKYGAANVEVTGHSLGGSQALHVGRKYGAVGTAFEPGSGPADAIKRAKDDLSHGKLKYLPVNAIHNAFSKTLSSSKGKRTGVEIIASAYKPKRVNTAHDAFTQAEYGIAALTRLPGHEKRTWVKPRYKDNHAIKNFV